MNENICLSQANPRSYHAKCWCQIKPQTNHYPSSQGHNNKLLGATLLEGGEVVTKEGVGMEQA
jgi:hypothetical protein